MPFELTGQPPRRIAVIGAGISGLGAAHVLSRTDHVTLIEADHRLGGHARTIHAGPDRTPVDTGFIVFNKATYPHLVRLFADLDVPVAPSGMSFGASLRGGRLEYGLGTLRAVFTQPRNALDPRFLTMLRDILRFNSRALSLAHDRRRTVGEFLQALGTGPWFRDYYLLPLSGAIWSTPRDRILDFPAHAMIQFFENHALLRYSGQHKWLTVQGGSKSYVDRLERRLRGRGLDIRLGTPVAGVRRLNARPEVRMTGGDWEAFDEVVFATHSDDTLRLLTDPTAEEASALGAIRYQPNRVVLHSDPAVMPRRRGCWSSWNYAEGDGRTGDAIDLTYWMNALQPIPGPTPYFVTLNSTRPIREELIHDETVLRHPVFDIAALDAQTRVAALNGTGATWYCGAWMRHGFHEDGLASAVEVADRLTRRTAPAIAAE